VNATACAPAASARGRHRRRGADRRLPGESDERGILDCDGDTVFATTRVNVAGASTVMYIAEQFTFVGPRIVDVGVHVDDVRE
jgi:hypothetical protein